jgi:hypothetical protein
MTQTPPVTAKSKSSTAIHEAAHCVIAYILDAPIASVFIEPEPGLGWSGETHCLRNSARFPGLASRLLILVAGWSIETAGTCVVEPVGCEGDRAKVHQELGGRLHGYQVFDRLGRSLWALWSRPVVAHAVAKVSLQLERQSRLDGAEVESLIRQAIGSDIVALRRQMAVLVMEADQTIMMTSP